MEKTQFIEKLRSKHFSLAVENEKLVLKGDKTRLSAEEILAIKQEKEVISYIRDHRDELIAHIRMQDPGAEKTSRDVTAIYRLSGLQEGMLFHAVYGDGTGAYMQQMYFELKGADPVLFRKTWDYLLKDHSILRSAFYYDTFKVPVQCVYRTVQLPFEERDYRHLAGADRMEAIQEYRKTELGRGFDLQRPPLMRFGLLWCEEDTLVVVWTLHHLLLDGWSLPVLTREFLQVYEILARGELPGEKEEDVFQDFIRYIEMGDKEKEETHWRSYLKGVTEGSLLPVIDPGIAGERNKGTGIYREAAVRLSADEKAQVDAYAAKHRLTVNTVVQGVWAYILHIYSGDADVLFGVTVSGRPELLSNVESRVGMYINTLPLRSSYSAEQSVPDWLQSIQLGQLVCREFQHTALSSIQHWTGIRGDLFDTLVVFENYPVNELLSSPQRNWKLEVRKVAIHEQSNYPLTLSVNIGSEIGIRFTYNELLIDGARVDALAGQLRHVLLQMTADPHLKLKDLRLMTDVEWEQVVRYSGVAKGGNFSLVGWLRERWEQGGGEPAIRYRGTTLSYEQLGRMVRRVSACLYEQMGLRRGDRVMVCCARSEKLVAVILALLDSGLVYVPADSGFPAGRLSVLLQDADPDCVIADDLHGEWFTRQGCLVADVALLCHWDGELLSCQPLPGADETAYIMYTSGSTGTPRGVMVSHANIDHLFGRVYERYGGQNITLPFTAAHSFDISLFQLLLPLLSGGSAEVVDRQQLEDLDALMDILAGANSIDAVPGVYRLWLTYIEERGLESKMTHIRQLFIGGDLIGEGLLHRLARVFCNAGITVLYGPTEATIFCTLMSYPAGQAGPHADGRLLGRPLSSTPIYILGPNGSLLPPGLEGEIAIGGDSVTQGYRNQPEETHKKFHADLFQQQWTGQPVCGRLYRTGDRGCWTPEGLLLFRGRKDNQVKVRGNRIELEEVARRLRELPGIGEAIVLVAPSASGDSSLVAYYTGEARQRQELTDHLGQYFAMAVLPAWYRQLPAFPLSENGKIDKGRLQWLAQQQSPDEQQYKEGPRNEAERRLTTIWELLLNREGIGIHDNFFELGGHSLLAMRLAAVVRKTFGKRLSVKTLFDNPTIALLAEQMEVPGLQPELPAITATLRGPADRMPLSFAQERLWFIDRLQGSVQYHMPWVFRLDGKLRPEHLGEAVEALVERHEVLRTILVEQDGIAEQRILQVGSQQGPALPAEQTTLLPQPLLRMLDPRAASQPLPVLIEQEVNRPFRLDREPPIRVSLLPIGEQQWLLIAVIHHIAFDAWSLPILVQELAELYRSACQHRPHTLAPLPIQYADYAVWQRQYLQGDAFDQKLAYWKQQLQGWERLALPTDHPRRAEAGIRGGIVRGQLDKAATGALARLSQQEGATLFMTLLTVFKILLYRYSGQQDILVGSPVAGREQQEVEGLIGFFVNTLVLRSQIRPNASLRELLQQEKQITLAAYEHQDVPFEKIVETLGVQRDRSRQPFFDVKLMLQNAPKAGGLDLGEVTMTGEYDEPAPAQGDISVDMAESGEGLIIDITYRRELYDRITIERLLHHYLQLLRIAPARNDLPVQELTLLDEAERYRLLYSFNETDVPFPENKSIIDIFCEQVRRSPGAIALVFGEQRMSYQDLDSRSDEMAHCLQQRGVCGEQIVAVCLDRGVDLIVCLFGILKAGAAYLPIDPEYPRERIGYMLTESQCTVCLTTTSLSGLLTGLAPAVSLIHTEGIREDRTAEMPGRPGHDLRPEQLAYVIYTSGSTGRPKGVMIEHRGVVNLSYSQVKPLRLRPGIIVFQFSSFSFDASCYELFCTLLHGGCLVMAPAGTIKDAGALCELLRREAVELITLPPSYQAVVAGEDIPIKTIVSAGEPLNAVVATQLEKKGIRVINAYGPTENTVCAILAEKPLRGNDRVTIGKPIANVRAYILDDNGQPVPEGVPGELCLGGAQVGRGYLHRPELTRERFVPDTFIRGGRSGMMYRTGDLARWLPDGAIEYIGRSDDQVKVRGYRIELGEVESVLCEFVDIEQAVAVVKEQKAGAKTLFAYVVAPDDLHTPALMEFLRQRLPDYMIPASIVVTDNIPLTNSGKVDRVSLANRGGESEAHEVTSSGEADPVLAGVLAGIWKELLSLDTVGLHDNFFELGGHSLLAIQLVSAVRNRAEKEMKIKDIFDFPTIATLSEHLASQTAGRLLGGIGRRQPGQPIPLSFAQERLWFIDKLKGSIPYHMPWSFRLHGLVDRQALETALSRIVDRHEILRTTIREEDGRGYQVILPAANWKIEYIDELPGGSGENELRQQLDTFIRRPFNLASDGMLRVQLIRLGERDHILAAVVHHIAFDAWSISIFVRELVENYQRVLEQRPSLSPALPVQYGDYAIWQRETFSGEMLERKLGYWKERLRGLTLLSVPTDHPRPANRSSRGAVVRKMVDAGMREALELFSNQQGATLYMTLLSVFKILLHRYTGETDICIGSSIAGRQRQELEGLIGFFVNMLPLRTNLDPTSSFREWVEAVKNTVLEGFENQEAPFEKITEIAAVSRNGARNVLFEVTFVLQNVPAPGRLELAGAELNADGSENIHSEFELCLNISQSAAGLLLEIIYSTDLFKPASMERMLEHYVYLLGRAVSGSGDRVEDIRMISEAEETHLEHFVYHATGDHVPEGTIPGLFAQQVYATPDAPALVFGNVRLSYGELDRRSNQLARYLQNNGLRAGDLAAVCIERSTELIVAILAILKTGAGYVPIDKQYPEERILAMIEDSGFGRIVTAGNVLGSVFSNGVLTTIDVRRDGHLIAEESDVSVTAEISPSSIAYLMYTSGTTGTPKGVVVEHGNVVSLVKDVGYVGLSSKNTLLSTGSPSFDATTFEYWGMLLNGGKLVLCDTLNLLDNRKLKEVMIAESVDMMWFTAGWFNELVDVDIDLFAGLRTVLAGGDKLSGVHVRKLAERYPGITIINGYGPTENTTFSLSHTIDTSLYREGDIPIGRPLDHRVAYIMDPGMRLCGIGVIGELYVGGAGLARGYWKREELTRERFIETSRFGRLYRTGDMARLSEEGVIEFLGRRDEQVKIRGFRVELKEIEWVLGQAPGIRQGVVVLKEEGWKEKTLVAYITADENVLLPGVAAYLGSKLPDYMIPSLIVPMESLPLTGNGKVDKRLLAALPMTAATGTAGGEADVLLSATEARLHALWLLLLDVEQLRRDDNFFERGGHSLLAIRVVAAIREEMAMEVSIKDLFDYPTIAMLARKLDDSTRELRKGMIPPIEKANRGPDTVLPLSFAQERIWFIDRLQGSVQYHMPWVFHLKGELDIDLLDHCLMVLVRRHEVLRTVIGEQDGLGSQRVVEKPGSILRRVSPEDLAGRGQTVDAYIRSEVERPFRLEEDIPLRVSLVPLAAEEFVLVAVIHHIAFDGWSLSIMVDELGELYRGGMEGRVPELQPLPVQYADFAVWQRKYLTGEIADEKLNYWKKQLSGWERLSLPVDRARGAQQSIRGAVARALLERPSLDRLVHLSNEEGVTLFMTLMAVFRVLLYRYTGQQDILVGSPVAGRGRRELEGLLGFFVNTVVLRGRVEGNTAMRTLLRQEKEIALGAYEHQDLPFEKIVEALGVERDMSRHPLFDVMFGLQNISDSDLLDLGEVTIKSVEPGSVAAKFDIQVDAIETPAGLRINAVYNADLYDQETMDALLAHYVNLLRMTGVPGLADRPVQELDIMSPEERQRIVRTFNDTTVPAAAFGAETMLDLMGEAVRRHPWSFALVDEQQTWTYAELDAASNRLAHYLRRRGIGEDKPVPICMERSPRLIVGLLGIMKAGGAYLPIDPAYPQERIRYMISDCQAGLMLSEAAVASRHAFGIECLLLDREFSEIRQEPAEPVAADPDPAHLVYVIYTSGSTGQPKGVMIEHRSLVNLVRWHIRVYQVNAESRSTPMAGIGFDAFGFEIWPFLAAGATLLFMDEKQRLSPAGFPEWYTRNGITHSYIPTAMVYEFLQETRGVPMPLNYLFTGGEQLRAVDMTGISYSLTDNYGPTECTVVATICRVSGKESFGSIGRPVENTTIYILDEHLRPVPVGVTGELYIGGVQVGRGYWNRPELTAERFIADPFAEGGGDHLLYRSGDLARWRRNGTIECFGRQDNQVKLRSYRIELGEIENVLQQAPGVSSAVVLLVTDAKGNKRLVGYAAGTAEAESVLAFARHRLPEYMVPWKLELLEAMPMTANGKVDRKELAGRSIERLKDQAQDYLPPVSELERTLASVWEELLGIGRVGLEDNFFELGGDSIITIQVVSRMKRFGYSLQPRDLFIYQTIARISEMITGGGGATGMAGEQGVLEGECGLLPIQRWFLENSGKGRSHFNQSILLTIDKEVGLESLAAAVSVLTAHHDALRFRYWKRDGEWQQEYGKDNLRVGEVILPADDWQGSMEKHSQLLQESLDIGAGIVATVYLFRTPADEQHNRLLWVIHHLVTDGVSWRILLDDLELLLKKGPAKEQLGAKTSSCREYYQALKAYGDSPKTGRQRNYWVGVVGAYEPLPADMNGTDKGSVDDRNNDRGPVHSEFAQLDEVSTRQLIQDTAAIYHTEINDILLAALTKTLCEWTGRQRVTVGMESHGREELATGIDTSRTIGWFTSIYPIGLSMLAGDEGDLIKNTKEQLRKVPDKGLGFGVLKYLAEAVELQLPDAWDIVFNYLGQADSAVGQGRWLQNAPESPGDPVGSDVLPVLPLEVSCIVYQGKLTINWKGDAKRYRPETVRMLAAAYLENLRRLILHCLEAGTHGTYPTPTDLGLGSEMSYRQLDEFLAEEVEGRSRLKVLDGMYRLSGLQEGMLFHGISQKGNPYTEQLVCDLRGLQIAPFRATWNVILQRHSILRSCFFYDVFDIPIQCVYKEVELPVTILDYSGEGPERKEGLIEACLKKESETDFDFQRPPLMRVLLLKWSEEEHTLIWISHHLLFDGWSLQVLIGEFLTLYDALQKGISPKYKEDRFEDHIRMLERRDKDQEERFWTGYLEGVRRGTALPFRQQKPAKAAGVPVYEEEWLVFGEEQASVIKTYTRRLHITTNTLVQGAWSYLLYRYTGCSDVLFGEVVSGRGADLADVGQRVGMYINTLPVRVRLWDERPVQEWLTGLQQSQSASRDHQHSHLTDIRKWSGCEGELFDTVLVFENYPINEAIRASRGVLEIDNVRTKERNNYPLSITVVADRELSFRADYDTAFIQKSDVLMILGHLRQLLLRLTDHQQPLLIRELAQTQEDPGSPAAAVYDEALFDFEIKEK